MVAYRPTLIRRILKRLHRVWFFRDFANMSTEERFSRIYSGHWWGKKGGSVSGQGSDVEATENIRHQLPKLWEEFGIKSFLDAPCGDWFWMKEVRFPDSFDYIGGEIVQDLVDKNTELYAKPNIRFVKLNICEDELPDADMWMCRDCLIHLEDSLVFQSLERFLESNIGYLLVTHYPDVTKNENIMTGKMRPTNLQLEPFNLPAPIKTIDDSNPPFQSRVMALWSRDQIEAAMKQRQSA